MTNTTINDTERTILEILSTSHAISAPEIVKNSGEALDIKNIKQILEEMVEKNLIRVSPLDSEPGLTQLKSAKGYWITADGRKLLEPMPKKRASWRGSVIILIVAIVTILLLYLK